MNDNKNLEIEEAKAQVHNLQCVISVIKRVFDAEEISMNEYEVEGMLDQLDELFLRLERLKMHLDALKTPPPEKFPVIQSVPRNGHRKISKRPEISTLSERITA